MHVEREGGREREEIYRVGQKDWGLTGSLPCTGGRVAFKEIPVGLRGLIMSISGRFTGIGMDGTRPLAEHAESLRLGFGAPFRLEVESFAAARLFPELAWEADMSGEEAEEEEELCL